jgi:hypothetical protein
MKKVLVYSLILVALVVLLHLETTEEDRMASRYADSTGAVDVLAFSTGQGLEEYPYLQGQIGFDNTILMEDMVLKCPDSTKGLWAALFDPDFELLGHENFDIETDAGRFSAISSFFRNPPLNSTAVVLIQGGLSLNEDSGWANYSNRFDEVALHAGYFDPGLPQYRRLPGNSGWLAMERGKQEDNTYSWTNGTRAEFPLWVSEPEDGVVYMRVVGVRDNGPQRHVFLEVNGNALDPQELPKELATVGFPISGSILNNGLNSCVVSTERTVNPFQARGANDKRPLGVMVDYVQYQANSDSLRSPDKDPHPDNKVRLRGLLQPGLQDDQEAFQAEDWFGRETGRDGRTYSWTRKTSVRCSLTVLDPGPGEIVVVGYGVPDGKGERYLSLKAGDHTLGKVVLPGSFGEMRFPVSREIGAQEYLDLRLELDRLTPAPRKDPRILGVLVSEIRFERNDHPTGTTDGGSQKLWLHAQRPVILPVGSFAGLKLHLGWETVADHGTPDILVTVTDPETGQMHFREEIPTSEATEIRVNLPEDLPESVLLYLGVSKAGPDQGVHLTKLVVGDASLNKISDLFATLGARVQPWQGEQASWTLVSTKRPRGWVPLSESFSLTSGVMSAVTIVPDRTKYDNFQGDFRLID